MFVQPPATYGWHFQVSSMCVCVCKASVHHESMIANKSLQNTVVEYLWQDLWRSFGERGTSLQVD